MFEIKAKVLGEKAERKPKTNPKEFLIAQDGWEIIERNFGPIQRVKSLKEGQRRPASTEDAFSRSFSLSFSYRKRIQFQLTFNH